MGIMGVPNTISTTDHGKTTSPLPTWASSSTEKDNTFAMFIMALGIASAGGFTMYTKQTGSLLRRMNNISKIQQGGLNRTTQPSKTRLKSKSDSTKNKYKSKTFHDKDDIF